MIASASIMHQYAKLTHKVGMTILNLEVKDLNRLVKRKKVYALNRCRTFFLHVLYHLSRQLSRKTPHLAEFRRILSSAEKTRIFYLEKR